MSEMLYPCIFLCCSVNGSVCLVCCVSDSVSELFGESLSVVVKLLLNVIEVLSVGGVYK